MNERLITTKEVAEMASVSVLTVRRWRKEGRAPEGFRLGKRLMFRQSAVQTWLDQMSAEGADAVWSAAASKG